MYLASLEVGCTKIIEISDFVLFFSNLFVLTTENLPFCFVQLRDSNESAKDAVLFNRVFLESRSYNNI